ncbi:dipeptidyl peptidase 9-like isoform X2 [Planococcus citri]|uniref:dipeptidyl peptidase 9-like isoform X2 n=1 Tax=Planococcus citri TaxID=170843 RepID=UPI0031F8E7CE
MLPNDQPCSTVTASTSEEEKCDTPEYNSKLLIQKKGKKTWREFKEIVDELRKQLSSLSTLAPTSICFRTYSDGRTRIFFLGCPVNGLETTLLYTDIPKDENTQPDAQLHWYPVIESIATTSKFSHEEQLMLERKRLATWGITSFELHEESGRLVFPTSSTLFHCTDNGFSKGPLFPTELRTNANGAKLSAQICPSNSDLVAYICNCDIWLSHTVTGSTHRLTYAHKGGKNVADDPLVAGLPSYVMREEFDRYQGYWWQPHSNGTVYRILYEETDESEVKIYNFPSTNSNGMGDIEQYRFPRAGTANSKSNLKLIEFSLNENLQIVQIKNLELQYPLSYMFPWMEYMVRAGWAPNKDAIWVQLLDRRQQRLELVLLSVENFTEPPPNMYYIESHLPPASPPAHIIYSQTSDVWINVHDMLYMFPITNTGEVTIIWASEETGYRHLYLITSLLPRPGVTNGFSNPFDSGDNNSYDSNDSLVVTHVALTSGEWEVLRRPLWVDIDRQLLYFMALRESPLEKHLYVVSLRRPGEIKLLTRPGFSYVVEFNKDCTMCVAIYSNIRQLPACQVFRITHTDHTVQGVHLISVGYLLEPIESDLLPPELYRHQIRSGETLYAMVFRPHCYQPGKKYPTVLSIYGGPEVQLVSNTFKGMRHLRMHMLASQGYCVIQIDSRGSQHRGLRFESHLRGKMGTIELSDQVEVLEWLAETLNYIDMSRIAVNGWSYGGYLSIMALAKYPHIFKLAIAGAPVTSWSLYDTGYTERYMDLPQHNQLGYKTGSVLSYVSQLPEEENRLLIVHGLIDENVHFHHTSQLINALVRQCKPYQLQIYPNERHSLRSIDASKHYETTLLSFLQNHL